MIRDIAIYVLIFALGMMAGYLLKVVMVKKGSRGQVMTHDYRDLSSSVEPVKIYG